MSGEQQDPEVVLFAEHREPQPVWWIDADPEPDPSSRRGWTRTELVQRIGEVGASAP